MNYSILSFFNNFLSHATEKHLGACKGRMKTILFLFPWEREVCVKLEGEKKST